MAIQNPNIPTSVYSDEHRRQACYSGAAYGDISNCRLSARYFSENFHLSLFPRHFIDNSSRRLAWPTAQ
jgi:hypothetical protein